MVVAWWLVVGSNVLPPRALPSPPEVARAFVVELSSSTLWTATFTTLGGWLASMVLVVAIAVPLGALLGRIELLSQVTRLPIEFLRAVPPISLIPAMVLMYGQTSRAAIVIAVLAGIWPMFIQTLYGTRSIDPALFDVTQSYRIPRSGAVVHVIIPAVLPYVYTGLRLSSALVLIALIGTEIIIGVPGIGNEINAARTAGNSAEAYALTIWTGILGLALSSLLESLNARASLAKRA